MEKSLKELLLRDLCARLPYGVKAHIEHDTFYDEIEPYDGMVNTNTINDLLHNKKLEVRPYLRPMPSMTEEEKEIYKRFCDEDIRQLTYVQEVHPSLKQKTSCHHSIDWLNAHHFDYRGLIEKGLALEAPEGMYNKKGENY